MKKHPHTVYPKKYAHGFVVLCFVVVMQSFIMNSYEVFIHIHQGSFAGTGAIIRLPQCQWSKPNGYGKISQCITTTKHSKAKTVCIFLGIYCRKHLKMLYILWKASKKITRCMKSLACDKIFAVLLTNVLWQTVNIMAANALAAGLAVDDVYRRFSYYWLCVKSPGNHWFPHNGPVFQSSDYFFGFNPNKLLIKLLGCWWFETPLRSC